MVRASQPMVTLDVHVPLNDVWSAVGVPRSITTVEPLKLLTAPPHTLLMVITLSWITTGALTHACPDSSTVMVALLFTGVDGGKPLLVMCGFSGRPVVALSNHRLAETVYVPAAKWPLAVVSTVVDPPGVGLGSDEESSSDVGVASGMGSTGVGVGSAGSASGTLSAPSGSADSGRLE